MHEIVGHIGLADWSTPALTKAGDMFTHLLREAVEEVLHTALRGGDFDIFFPMEWGPDGRGGGTLKGPPEPLDLMIGLPVAADANSHVYIKLNIGQVLDDGCIATCERGEMDDAGIAGMHQMSRALKGAAAKIDAALASVDKR